MIENRLSRSESDQIIGGVCGGLASYINVDPIIVRALFALLLFASGIGLPIYLVLWFIMPSENDAQSQGREILEANFDDMGKTVSDKMSGLGNPGTIGTLLIIFGGYFLLNELGIIAWMGGAFWPALIIIAGAYLLIKRSE